MASRRMLSAAGLKGCVADLLFKGTRQNAGGLYRNKWAAEAQSASRLLSQDTSSRSSSASTTQDASPVFDEKLLEHLVCPLSKKDLRYDKEKNELVCDEIGVAYPIVNGIPNLIPQDARMLKESSSYSSPS